MPSINEVRLMGHAGRDMEMYATPSGDMVMKVTLATNYKDRVEWHNIEAWNYQGPPIYKGDLMYVSGYLRYFRKDDRVLATVKAHTLFKLRGRSKPAEGEEAKEDEHDIPF